MKISIITAIKDSAEFLEDNINSVYNQNYTDKEHIIIDACSTDSTKSIIEKNKSKITAFTSEQDKGMYDGINKGLSIATGDIIAILNGDDIYADDNILSDVAATFKNNKVDAVYGDLVYVDRIYTSKVIRYWRAGEGDRSKIVKGWMPPHPALFIKKEIYDKHGSYNLDFRISADYEIILRFLFMHRISMSYMHRLCVKMRTGGVSNRSIFTIAKKSYEDYKACKIYGLKKAAYTVMLKNLRKMPQFFRRRSSVC